MKTTKKQPKNPKTWNFDKEVFYKCKKCGGIPAYNGSIIIKINNMDEQINKQIIEVKHKLEESGIDYSHLVFMPVIPLIDGFVYEFILEEHYGIKVAKLVSAPDD